MQNILIEQGMSLDEAGRQENRASIEAELIALATEEHRWGPALACLVPQVLTTAGLDPWLCCAIPPHLLVGRTPLCVFFLGGGG